MVLLAGLANGLSVFGAGLAHHPLSLDVTAPAYVGKGETRTAR